MNTPHRSYESFFCAETQLVSGNMPSPHFHDTYEIYYLISGSRRHLVRHDMFDVYPGDFVLIPSMTIHQTLNVPHLPEGQQHKRYRLSPSREMIPDLFLPLFETYHHRVPQEFQSDVLRCFEELGDNARHRDVYSPYVDQAVLIRLLTILARCPAAERQNTATSSAERQMRLAAAYIKEYCAQPLTLDTVAKHFGFSREYFSTLFKSVIGFGFSYYLNQMRISKASTLLLSTQLPVGEVSRLCGFNDSNYFSAVFKKTLSVTPLQFREQKNLPIL